ncbi:cell division protein CrgA [Cellulosimicrobium arenosum]|uniref:Cell division protein CrgA n=1 Tax=Cellulosimicrobium arenosum TaxID=2708133 RepID=A0A927PFH4_9MICO|nr:cell division protein CrgA [Cellulosimicrobium arenosum]
MPESKSRKKPAKAARAPREPRAETGNPRWLVPTMLTLMLLGLAWIVLFYLSGSRQLPIPALEYWNLAVGFALIIAGFVLTTRWK